MKTPLTEAAIYQEDTGYNGMVDVVSPAACREIELKLNEFTASLCLLVERIEREVDLGFHSLELIAARELLRDNGFERGENGVWAKASC